MQVIFSDCSGNSLVCANVRKRDWSLDQNFFLLVSCYPFAHSFRFQVQVNGKTILAETGSRSKKDAKMAAAAAAVRQLGLSS